jgi:hypothetical protein
MAYKQQEDGFEVQAGPSPSSLREGGGNRIPELAGTLATAASLRPRGGGRGLRSRGGGEERELRFREGPTYLVGTAVVGLISGGDERDPGHWGARGRMEVAEEARDGGRKGARADGVAASLRAGAVSRLGDGPESRRAERGRASACGVAG